MNDNTSHKYICSACGATFSTRDGLRQHIYNAHIQDETKIKAIVDAAAASNYCLAKCKDCISVCKREKDHVEGQHECWNGHKWR